MQTRHIIITTLLFAVLFSCHNPTKAINKTPWPKAMIYAYEPSDSAIYKHIKYDFYLTNGGQLCERKLGDAWDTNCSCHFMVFYDSIFSIFNGDTTIKRPLGSVVDIHSFIWIDSTEYSKDKNTVFYFYNNSDGGNRVIVDKAEPATFKRLARGNWGIDENFVFYKKFLLGGLNLKKLRVLYPPDTANHWVSYIKDDKLVYYENEMVAGADAKTFNTVNGKPWDAEDKNYKYEYGKRKN